MRHRVEGSTAVQPPWWTALLLIGLFFLPTPAATQDSGGQNNLLLSRLLDRPVTNERNEELGELEDIVFRRNGRIKLALITTSGFLGFGQKLIAIPYNKLDVTAAGEIKIPLSSEQIGKWPAFNLNQPLLYSGTLSEPPPIPGAEGQLPYAPPYRPFQAPGEIRPDRKPPEAYREEVPENLEETFNYPFMQWYSPAKVMGSAVFGQVIINGRGKRVAEVEDLVISRHGTVEQIILSTGSLLSLDDRKVAVAFRPLRFNKFGMVYDISASRMEKLPQFEMPRQP